MFMFRDIKLHYLVFRRIYYYLLLSFLCFGILLYSSAFLYVYNVCLLCLYGLCCLIQIKMIVRYDKYDTMSVTLTKVESIFCIKKQFECQMANNKHGERFHATAFITRHFDTVRDTSTLRSRHWFSRFCTYKIKYSHSVYVNTVPNT